MRHDIDVGDVIYIKLLGMRAAEEDRVVVKREEQLIDLQRFEEAKSVLRKMTPKARRVLGESHELTLRMKLTYARALYGDPGATLDDLREAVTTLEDTERTARRVLGGTHPVTTFIECHLRNARAALAARDGDVSSVCEAMEAMTPA